MPVGPQREYRYCKTCAEVCPKGEKPKPRKPENGNVEQGGLLKERDGEADKSFKDA